MYLNLTDLESSLILTKKNLTEYTNGELDDEEIKNDNDTFFQQLQTIYQAYLSELEGCASESAMSSEKNKFLLYFGAVVNLYFLTGMHLVYPKDTNDTTKENENVFLTENKGYFITKLCMVIQDEPLLIELQQLYYAITEQNIEKFQDLQKTHPSFLLTHCIFYCQVDRYFQALLRNFQSENEKEEANLEEAKLKAVEEALSLSYAQHQRDHHGLELLKEFALSYTDYAKDAEHYLPIDQPSMKLSPVFPLPYFRYNMTAVNTLSESLEIITELKTLLETAQKKSLYLKNHFNEQKIKNNIEELELLQKDKEVGTVDLTKQSNQFFSLDSHSREYRGQFLKMPHYVDMKRSTFMILLDSLHKQNQLEQQQKEREKLFEEQSHNWKHTSYPKIASDVGQFLRAKDTDQDVYQGHKLEFVYVSNMQLLGTINLLRLEYGASEEEFSKIFRKDIFRKNYKKYLPHPNNGTPVETVATEPLRIKKILLKAFEIVTFRLFLPESDPSTNAELMREEVIYKTELSHLPQSFYDNILVYEEYDREQEKELGVDKEETKWIWFSRNGYPITHSFSPFWEELRFDENKPGYAVMMNFLINLLLNAINHGVKSKEGQLSIFFTEEEQEGISYLCIVFENKMDSSTTLENSEGKGLQGIENRLKKVNVEKKLKQNVVTSTPKENVFRTELWIEKQAFWVKEESII